MLGRILLGLFIIAVGAALMYFSGYMVESFGRIQWAENNLGGTRNGYLLFGFVLMIVGVLIMFGILSVNAPLNDLPTLAK